MEEQGGRVGRGVRDAVDGGRSSEAGGRCGWPPPTAGPSTPCAISCSTSTNGGSPSSFSDLRL